MLVGRMMTMMRALPLSGGPLVARRALSSDLPAPFSLETRSVSEQARDLRQEFMDRSWYELDDSLVEEAQSLLASSVPAEAKDDVEALSRVVKVALDTNQLYERVHETQQQIADPLGDIVPDASAEVMEEADELFREYETLVHSMDREFEKKVSQELGRQMVVLKSSLHVPNFRSNFDFKGPEIQS